MRKVILYSAASLDNLIARKDGGIDWLHYPEFEIPNEDYGYQEFYDGIDTTLMGNNTYKLVLGFDVPFPYSNKTNYVFTRSAEHKDNDDVKFISTNIPEFVSGLKNQSGKDIWLIGGGQINALLLSHGLIDRIIVTLIPIVLGDGIPLFDGKSIETNFELSAVNSFKNGLVKLSYHKKQRI